MCILERMIYFRICLRRFIYSRPKYVDRAYFRMVRILERTVYFAGRAYFRMICILEKLHIRTYGLFSECIFRMISIFATYSLYILFTCSLFCTSYFPLVAVCCRFLYSSKGEALLLFPLVYNTD